MPSHENCHAYQASPLDASILSMLNGEDLSLNAGVTIDESGPAADADR